MKLIRQVKNYNGAINLISTELKLFARESYIFKNLIEFIYIFSIYIEN